MTLSNANPVSKLKKPTGTEMRKARKKIKRMTRIQAFAGTIGDPSLNVSLYSNSPVLQYIIVKKMNLRG